MINRINHDKNLRQSGQSWKSAFYKNMNSKTQKILKDIYKVDKNLRQDEGGLIEVVEKLSSAKPDIKLDKKFVRELRSEIASQAKELSTNRPKIKFWENFILPNRLAYAFGGAVLVLLLILPYIYNQNQSGLSSNSKISSNVDINDTAKQDEPTSLAPTTDPASSISSPVAVENEGATDSGKQVAALKPDNNQTTKIVETDISSDNKTETPNLIASTVDIEIIKKLVAENGGEEVEDLTIYVNDKIAMSLTRVIETEDGKTSSIILLTAKIDNGWELVYAGSEAVL